MKTENGKLSKVVYYNHNQLHRIPIRLYAHLLNDEANIDNVSVYRDLEKTVANIPVDRTGVYPHYLRLTDIPRIPSYDPTFSRSFEDLCYQRAKEIADKYERVHVMWSGGIDSTCVLASFAEILPSKRLILNFNLNSVLESGNLFDCHIKHRVQQEIIPSFSCNRFPLFKKGDIIVHGMAGNQICWGNTFLYRHDTPTLLANWDAVISSTEYSYAKPLVEASQRPITTFLEYKWWMMFNLTYFGCHGTYFYGLPKSIQDSMISFYMTDDFQRWSMASKEPMEDIFSNPKQPMRKVIVKEFPDTNYISNKRMFKSGYSPFKANWLFVLDTGETLWAKTNQS